MAARAFFLGGTTLMISALASACVAGGPQPAVSYTTPADGTGGTVSGSGATATFRPAASLPYNTTLTAEITTAVKDASGNALAANHTWTFSTQQTVSNAVLRYTYIFPTGGAFSRSVLKSGSVPGVSGSTIAGIWIGYDLSSGSQTTTITSIAQQ